MARLEACDHSDQYVLCPVCDGPHKVSRPSSTLHVKRRRNAVTARLEGPCALGSDRIHEGDQILSVSYDGESYSWAHVDCIEDAEHAGELQVERHDTTVHP